MNKIRKFLIALLTFAMTASLCMFAACGGDEVGDATIQVDGQSTLLQTDKSPEELNPDEVIYSFLYKQSQFTSYKITTTGSTYAKKGLINYTQNIENVSIKNGDEYFAQSVSTSTFVNLTHQSFAKTVDGESKVAYRNADGGDISTAARSDYKGVYGVSPDDVALGGYIVNANTVKSFSVDVSDKNALKYTVALKADSDEGLGAMKAQMKQFGGLDDYPVFSDIKLTLTLKSDWTPVSLVTEASYSIKIAVLGEMNCTQSLTATYSDVNGAVAIPDTQDFNSAVGSTPTTVTPVVTQKSPIYQVAERFASYDWATGRVFNLTAEVSYGESKQEATAELYAKYNPEAIEKGYYADALNFYLDADLSGLGYAPTLITALNTDLYHVAEKIDAATLYYIGDGNLYVTLSNRTDGTVYLIDSVNLGEKLGGLIGSVNLGGLTSVDVESLAAQIEQSFDIKETDKQISFVLNDEILESLNLLLTGGNAAVEEIAFAAYKTDGEISGIGVNASISVSDITLSFSAKLDDGGALKAGRTDADAEKVQTVLYDESEAREVREKIDALSYIKAYGEVYYQSYVQLLRDKYDALEDEQKALVVNSCSIPDENGEVSVIPAVLDAMKELASYDYESGMHFGIDLDVGRLGAAMYTSMMIKGDLYLKIDGAALAAGDLAAGVNFRFDADISDFNSLISLIAMFGGDMIPDDILPIEISALTNLYSVSLFYIGNGNLYVVLNSGEYDEDYNFVNANLPLAFFEAPLTTPDYNPETPISSVLELIAALGDPVTALKGLEGAVTATDTVTGVTISLNEEYVTQIAEAYNDLIESLTQSLDAMIGSILSGLVSAQVDGVKIEIENDGLLRGVKFMITGVPQGATDSIVLLELYLTPESVLTGELDGNAEYLSNVKSDSEKAAAVIQTLDELIENFKIEQSYLDALDEADSAYEALTDAQKSMVTNATTVSGYETVATTTYLRTLYSNLKNAADQFNGYLEKGWDNLTDDDWTAMNALYDSGNTIYGYPAIKDSSASKAYIGEDNIEAYISKRMGRENPTVEYLIEKISEANGIYTDDVLETEDGMRALLDLYYSDIKPKYEKLSDESKELVTEYVAFEYNALKVNLDGVTKAMNALTAEMQKYVDAEEITYKQLIELYTRYNEVYAWAQGTDNLNWYLGNIQTNSLSYSNWRNGTFPETLSKETAAALSAYSALSAITKSTRTETGAMSALAVKYLTEWYRTSDWPQSTADAGTIAGSPTKEEAEELYEQVTYLYYVCSRLYSRSVQVTTSDGKTEYVYSILSTYRETLQKYINPSSTENA